MDRGTSGGYHARYWMSSINPELRSELCFFYFRDPNNGA